MQSALRIGRIGPLTIYLNYSWLIAVVLGLWWTALLWLPDHFPNWSGIAYWLAAIVTMALFLCSVILHELAHSAIAKDGPRTINLYPFGATMPFRMQNVEPGRAIAAAAVGPVLSLAIGIALLLLGGAFPIVKVSLSPGIVGIIVPLGWLNLWLGTANFIPGIPFDGGWVLASVSYWFSGERESGLKLARTIGGLAALLLILFGAWVGLTTDSWLRALALVLLGWTAREAGEISKQRTLLLDAFRQVTARELMDISRPSDAVRATDTVADLVRTHQSYPPHEPLPALDEQGKLAGIVTLAATDTLLQGNWATTPVRALVVQPSELGVLTADAPLTDVIGVAEARQHSPDSETFIPIVEDGQLVGSIEPSRVDAFKQAGQEVGLEETLDANARPGGFFSRLGSALPIIMVIAAMAILGNIALHTNPGDVRDVGSTDTQARITFSNFVPEQSAIVGVNLSQIGAQMAGDAAVTTATLTLDGQPLDARLSGDVASGQVVTATINGLTQGIHNVKVTAITAAGRRASKEWQFRSVLGATSQQTPTAQAGGQPLAIVRYAPPVGGQVLAGATQVSLGVEVEGSPARGTARISLDGRQLDTSVKPVAGKEGVYSLMATAPSVQAGNHLARVEIQGEGSAFYSAEWAFTALAPDANNAYFKETGYFVSQPFLKYWQDNGGLAIFGYPISDRLQETITGTQQTYTAQYFERARFELHPDIGNQVVLGRLGALLHAPSPAVDPKQGAQFFKETGHNLSGPFLDFWNKNGGLALFGYPISEEVQETSPTDGKTYTVQYFERARFELHPEFAGTPNEVQLGQLGTQLYNQKYK